MLFARKSCEAELLVERYDILVSSVNGDHGTADLM